jgi:hypothetical protein
MISYKKRNISLKLGNGEKVNAKKDKKVYS